MCKLRWLKKKLINSVNLKEKVQKDEEPAKVVWGKFIRWLRERGYPILHAACGELTEVCIKNEELIVNVSDKSTYNMLEANFEKLTELITEISNLKLRFLISVQEENKELNMACKKLGDLLKIK